MGGTSEDTVYAVFANAALAGGDAPAARQASRGGVRHTVPVREVFTRSINPMAEAAWPAVIWSRPAGGPTTPSRWYPAGTNGRADGARSYRDGPG